MATKTIIVHVKGFLREMNKLNLPEEAGIFFVYEAFYNTLDQTVDLLHLIYIGSASNIRSRVMHHELTKTWMDFVNPDHELCFAWASVDDFDRERVKSAFNISQNPPANRGQSLVFSYETTTLVSTGKAALIPSVITVRKSKKGSSFNTQCPPRMNIVPVRAVHLYQ